MEIIDVVNESKRRTNFMNAIAIDWQYAQQLIKIVLNETKQITPEFRQNARTLHILFNNMEESIRELKDLIPTEEVMNALITETED